MEINLLSGALGASKRDKPKVSDKNWEVINNLMLEHKVLFRTRYYL